MRDAIALDTHDRQECWWYLWKEERETVGRVKGVAQTKHGLCSCVGCGHVYLVYIYVQIARVCFVCAECARGMLAHTIGGDVGGIWVSVDRGKIDGIRVKGVS